MSLQEMDVRFLAGLVVAVLCAELVKSECDNVSEINGCSVPFDLPFPYKNAFKPACNRHDVCYSCGSGRGVGKLHCDNAFLAGMFAICLERIWDLPLCYDYALRYYSAVLAGGSFNYEKKPLGFCGQAWVPDCMP